VSCFRFLFIKFCVISEVLSSSFGGYRTYLYSRTSLQQPWKKKVLWRSFGQVTAECSTKEMQESCNGAHSDNCRFHCSRLYAEAPIRKLSALLLCCFRLSPVFWITLSHLSVAIVDWFYVQQLRVIPLDSVTIQWLRVIPLDSVAIELFPLILMCIYWELFPLIYDFIILSPPSGSYVLLCSVGKTHKSSKSQGSCYFAVK